MHTSTCRNSKQYVATWSNRHQPHIHTSTVQEAQHEVERGSSTARMERLQAFVRQLMSDGDVRDLLYALQPLSRLHSARTRCEEQGVQPAKQESDAPAVAFPGLDPTPSAQHIDSRQKLLELFATVDDDVNGRINASQFRGACCVAWWINSWINTICVLPQQLQWSCWVMI